MTGLLAPIRSRLPGWAAPATLAAAGLAAVSLVALLDPETRGALSPGCPFRTTTGLDCPGCGATRALYALTRGDVALAANHNLLLVVALPWVAWAFVRWSLVRMGRSDRLPNVRPGAAWAITGAVLSFALARNLPWWPLSWLGSAPL
jgi:hypothetical protein